VQDINAADIFLSFVPSDKELVDATVRSSSRGGRHFEFGYAYGQGKLCVFVGPKENVFHYLPLGVRHFETYQEAKDFLLLLL